MPLLPLRDLRCPLDGDAMQRQSSHWQCPKGHSFDIARQGYVNLLPVQHKKSRDPGDSKAMVAARKAFLDSGFYAPIATAISQLCTDHLDTTAPLAILDAGCGEGYYLQALCAALDTPEREIIATGLDISKWALRACLQRNRQLNGIVASNRQVPLPDHSQQLLLCAFGFPVYREFARLLAPGGLYLQVDAGPDHLLEMREHLYPELRRSEAPSIQEGIDTIGPVLNEQRLQFTIDELTHQPLEQLLMMTPHYHRASPAAQQRLLDSAPLPMTADLVLRLLRVEGP